MFEHTSNSFLFLAVAAVALIVWLDSRTSSHPGRRYSFAGNDQPQGQRNLPLDASQARPAAPAAAPRSVEPQAGAPAAGFQQPGETPGTPAQPST